MGEVITFDASERRQRGPVASSPADRAVTLALSHSQLVRIFELIRPAALSAGRSTAGPVDAFKEVVETLLDSITGGRGPELQTTLEQMIDRWQAEIEELQSRAAPRCPGADYQLGYLYGLSSRTMGCLGRAGIETVADLLNAHDRGLWRIPGIGAKSREEIDRALADDRNREAVA